jgi:hypothetical protein
MPVISKTLKDQLEIRFILAVCFWQGRNSKFIVVKLKIPKKLG